MPTCFRNIIKVFLSRRTAVLLLIITAALLAVSAIYPESGVVSSPFFLVLPAVIFTSISLCVADRIRKKKEKDAGFWGSVVFHLGMLVIIAAGVATSQTLFTGEMLLTEGYPVSLGREGFLRIDHEPAGGMDFPAGSMTLKGFSGVWHGNSPVDYAARVVIERGGRAREEVIKVNEPLTIDGLQYLLNRYGFSPAFVIKDEKGETLLDAFINLVVVEGAEDSFEVPGTNYRVYVRFFPDFEMTKDGPTSKSRQPNNPVAALRVVGFGKELKAFRLVKPGETADVLGLEITFAEYRYWNHLLVSRDPGLPVFVAGFIMVVAGLSIRLFASKGLAIVALIFVFITFGGIGYIGGIHTPIL